MTFNHTPECDQVSAGDDCIGGCPPVLEVPMPVAPPTRKALDAGDLADHPRIPLDVRAARAWHRAMVNRDQGRNVYAQNLRMYVRFAVDAGDLVEAEHRLAALLAYADAV